MLHIPRSDSYIMARPLSLCCCMCAPSSTYSPRVSSLRSCRDDISSGISACPVNSAYGLQRLSCVKRAYPRDVGRENDQDEFVSARDGIGLDGDG